MSPPLITLHTTMAEFEGLHERCDRTRSTSKSVTVDREALIHLLMDHSRLIEALRQAGQVQVSDGGCALSIRSKTSRVPSFSASSRNASSHRRNAVAIEF